MGIGWLSGGMLRILGEYAASNDEEDFNRAYTLSRLVYLVYGLIIALGILAVAYSCTRHRWGYVLAGGVIFWLGSARLFAIYAYSTAKLKRLNMVAFLELILKLILSVFLFPIFSYLSCLVAVNLVYLFGIAIAYRKIIPRDNISKTGCVYE